MHQESLAKSYLIYPVSRYDIKDNYPKILRTMDLIPKEFNGVKKINAVDWLLDKTEDKNI